MAKKTTAKKTKAPVHHDTSGALVGQGAVITGDVDRILAAELDRIFARIFFESGGDTDSEFRTVELPKVKIIDALPGVTGGCLQKGPAGLHRYRE